MAPESPASSSPPPARGKALRLRLLDDLDRRTATAAGELVARVDGDPRLTCLACAHRCRLVDGQRGICGVRVRHGEAVHVPSGYVARRHVRAVETNTIFHVRPGAQALTFGMYGCDLACGYCHNSRISQALREGADESPIPMTAEALVDEAVAAGCEVVCAAYNEPMIAAEWTHAIFSEAKARGLVTAVISDGHTTPEALAYLRPVADVFRVDLKAGTDEGYRSLGGDRTAVLDGLAEARRLGFWVEVVTLVVPGLNDSPRELRGIARHLARLDPDIPWHVNAFQPRYRMRDRPPAFPAVLASAAGSGYAQGLRYVYASNVPGVTELGHTRCPSCASVLITRANYATLERHMNGDCCASCGAQVPGIWRRD